MPFSKPPEAGTIQAMPFSKPPQGLSDQIEQLDEMVESMLEQAAVLISERLFVAAEELIDNAAKLKIAVKKLSHPTRGR